MLANIIHCHTNYCSVSQKKMEGKFRLPLHY
jgi:hypothetical protein